MPVCCADSRLSGFTASQLLGYDEARQFADKKGRFPLAEIFLNAPHFPRQGGICADRLHRCARPPPSLLFAAAMSELKRKRELDDEERTDAVDTVGEAPASSSSSAAASAAEVHASCSSSPSSTSASPAIEGGGGKEECGTNAANSKASSPKKADGPEKILICGKEVALKQTGGRKKRKHPMDTLIILAYKGRLAMACKANNMMAALEIYREMKSKGIKQDLSVSLAYLNGALGLPGSVLCPYPLG